VKFLGLIINWEAHCQKLLEKPKLKRILHYVLKITAIKRKDT
jgi:hypothetical protein